MPCVYPNQCRPAPGTLDESNYASVAHHMLDQEGHQAELRLNLINFHGNEREEHVMAYLGARTNTDSDITADTSFTQQMHAVRALAPDYILATFRSAVPVLSAVAGYHEAAGEEVPQLDIVDVSRELHANRYHHGLSDGALQRKAEYETVRLSKISGSTVVVIDEFYMTGRALRGAGSIARNAGAKKAYGMLGNWYRKIPDELTEVGTILRRYDGFMRKIGRMAAEIPPNKDKPMYEYWQIVEQYDNTDWIPQP